MNLIFSALDSPPSATALVGWLLLVGIALLTWALVSFPAYLVELFVRQSRQRIAAFARGLADSVRPRTTEAEARSAFGLFYRTHRLRYLSEENRGLWERTVTRIAQPITDLATAIEHTQQTLIHTSA